MCLRFDEMSDFLRLGSDLLMFDYGRRLLCLH